MAYTNNVPQGNQTIASTTDPIRNNFAFIETSINQEHNFDATDATKTYHLQASMPDKMATPALPAGTNGIYYVQAGEARFVTNGGDVCQFSLGVASQLGYQWVGRSLMQWGVVNLPGTGSVTFNIAFPTNVFNIQCTPISPLAGTSQDHVVGIKLGTANAAGFQFNWNGTTSYPAFYWFAVGN